MKDNITSNIIFQSFQFAIKTLQQHFSELTIDNNETVKHPAIILKNLDNSCIVIPLSSQQPKSDKFCVQINSVYGFPSFTRWANVTNIREIDNSRIDFLRKIGNVNSKVMQEISEKMHICGIL